MAYPESRASRPLAFTSRWYHLFPNDGRCSEFFLGLIETLLSFKLIHRLFDLVESLVTGLVSNPVFPNDGRVLFLEGIERPLLILVVHFSVRFLTK